MAPRLTFLGCREGREKAAAFVTSQMIVVSSWTEGFPLVISEAMAAGLPVIATRVGAIPDDEGLRRRISKRVHEHALHEFAIEVGCGKAMEVIKGVLRSTPAAVSNPELHGRR